MNGMAKEFAQQAFTTKDGKELQICPPQDQDDSEGEASTEVLEDGTVVKKKKGEKKRKRGDRQKYKHKESNAKEIDMRDLYTEDPSK